MSAKWFMPSPAASGPIYELRCERGLSRRELAELSGVALATIGRIERGESSRPHRSTLQALAEALGAEVRAGRNGGAVLELDELLALLELRERA